MTHLLVPGSERDVIQEEEEDAGEEQSSATTQSLIIPITSSTTEQRLFIEKFSEEMPDTPSSTLLQVLKDENAPLNVWADAALLYIQHKQHAREASAIFKRVVNECATLKECGRVLPALLGLAAVMYLEKNYEGAQGMCAEAMRLYPNKSGAAARVGFGLACYRLGQVDRANAAFARALEMDPENVDAMVGSAVLDMASLDETSVGFNSQMEKAIKMMTMANLLDHSNVMVRNHLANHFFWNWMPMSGTVQVVQGSNVVGSQPIPLEEGKRIRIGTDFETSVAEYGDKEEDNTFRMKDPWNGPTTVGLKVWKKDYDRAIALAKGAYNTTIVPEIQAESSFFLARVYHVRDELDNASSFYDRACKLAPHLGPAGFGLAQTLIAKEPPKYDQAASRLQLLLGTSSTATDALAILGLLEVKRGDKITEGLAHLRKAIDLDPLNPELVLLEALDFSIRRSLDHQVKILSTLEADVPYPV